MPTCLFNAALLLAKPFHQTLNTVSPCSVSPIAAEVMETLNEHYKVVSDGRDQLYDHLYKAKYHPQKYAAMMIDGMTKNVTTHPRFKPKPKCWEKKNREQPKQHETAMMGSHIANVGYFCDFFQQVNISDNANFCVDMIHRNITRLQNFNNEHEKPNPQILYLQLDNVSHNKGTLLLQYLSFLVASGVFLKIKVCYLLVGHTHEYIDQFFSRWASLVYAYCDVYS